MKTLLMLSAAALVSGAAGDPGHALVDAQTLPFRPGGWRLMRAAA